MMLQHPNVAIHVATPLDAEFCEILISLFHLRLQKRIFGGDKISSRTVFVYIYICMFCVALITTEVLRAMSRYPFASVGARGT